MTLSSIWINLNPSIPNIYCAISVVEICLIFLEVYTILKVYFQSEELNWGLNVAQIT